MTQQARNLGLFFAEQQIRFLIRDRDSKYSGPLDKIFRGERIRIVQTPIRAPKANAIAERFVRTVRAECLDWLLILNRRHLERVLRVYADHYNTQRPHRALDLQPPDPAEPPPQSTVGEIRRRDKLGASSMSTTKPPHEARARVMAPFRRRAHRQFADGYVVGVWSPAMRNADANGAHWTFAAGRRAAVRVYTHHPEMPIRPSRTRRTLLAGTPAIVFEMPPRRAGFYAGHVGVEWATSGSTFHLTMHGIQNAARVETMARAMIRQIRACSATTGRPPGGQCTLVFRP